MDNFIPNAIPPVVPDLSPKDLPDPVATITSPSKQYDDALSTGSPQAMVEIAKANFGTPVGTAALSAAETLHAGNQKFEAMKEPIEKAGGPNTPEGHLAISKSMKLAKDEPMMGEALVQWLSGNGKYARDILTGGKITSEVKPDINGKLVQVYTNALGKVVRAHDINSDVDMSADDYQKRSVGRQTYENTIDYLSNKQNAEANIKAFKEGELKNNNVTAGTQVIADLSGRLMDSLEKIKNLEIDPQEELKISRFVNSSLSNANSSNTSKTILDQATANAATKQGQSLTDKEKIGLKLPVGESFTWGKEGVVGSTQDKSKSWTQLRSGTGTESSNAELNTSYNQDRASLVNYLKKSGLKPEEQLHFTNAMDLAKQIGTAQAEMIGTHGKPAFLPLPNASTSEDPYALMQAKAIQNIAGAGLMQAYQQYVKEYKTSNPTYAINPGELEAGFSRSPEYQKIIKDAKEVSNSVISAPRKFKAPVKEESIIKTKPSTNTSNDAFASGVRPTKRPLSSF